MVKHRQGGYLDITTCVTPDAGHVGRKSINHSPGLRPSLPGQRESVKPKETIGGNLLERSSLSLREVLFGLDTA